MLPSEAGGMVVRGIGGNSKDRLLSGILSSRGDV